MASRGRLKSSKSRKGRRPMRVDTMLRKEKEGTLYKYTKLGSMEDRLQRLYRMRGLDENGEPIKLASSGVHGSDQASLNYREGDPPHMTGYVPKKRKKGDVPTRGDTVGGTTSESRQEGSGVVPASSGQDVGKYAASAEERHLTSVSVGAPLGAALGLFGSIATGTSPKKMMAVTSIGAGLGAATPHIKDSIGAAVGAGIGAGFGMAGALRGHIRHGMNSKAMAGLPIAGAILGGMVGEALTPGKKKSASIGKLATAPKTHFNLPDVYPSREADTSKAYPQHLARPHELPQSFYQLSDLGAVEKSASMAGFTEELVALENVLTPGQLDKLADVTRTEAEVALKRLKKLEKDKPSVGQIARGGAVGALVGPMATLAYRAAAGKRGRMGHPIWLGTRAQGATAAHGAVFGGALPAGRHKLERETEKQKLREYVGHRRRGTLRGKIRKHTGL